MSGSRTALAELQHAVDLFVLGFERPEDLPAVAVNALVAGLDGPALVTLAGAQGEDVRLFEMQRLVAAVSGEVGLLGGSSAGALARVATDIAGAILDGDTTEIDGARRIWDLCSATAGPPPLALHTFIYAASEWDRPEMRDEFRRAIREAARELTAPWPPAS